MRKWKVRIQPAVGVQYSCMAAIGATLLGLYCTVRNSRRGSDVGAVSAIATGHSFATAGGTLCPEGWVLPQISLAMREQVDLAAKTWYHDLPHILRKAYNDASEMKALGGPVREPASHLRFDVLMQPVEGACPRLARIGGMGDGGKLVCGLDRIPHSTANPYIVYSVGGNNNWKFEEDMVRSTSSSVHTFDCTVDGHVPADITDRFCFHNICLGAGSRNSRNTSSTAFTSLKEIMAMLDHDHITLLKMDIEGHEYDVFDYILSDKSITLPEQVSFELHYQTQMPELDRYGREHTAGEMVLLFAELYEAGYRVVSREDNNRCNHCSKFTIVRFHCPSDEGNWSRARTSVRKHSFRFKGI